MKAKAVDWARRWGWAVAVVACYFAFLDRGLNEPDEGRYAEIGREMALDGDWFTPHLNGIPHFQKPPLLYWLTSLSIKAFGAHAWVARLPAVLAALGTLMLTGWIAKMLLGAQSQRPAMLALASCAGFFALARLLTPDMLLTFWITAALACVVRRQRDGSEAWGWAFFAAMGLGFMTKGPMALVVPLSATLAMRAATPRERRPSLPWIGGLALALALGLWWFVAHSLHNRKLFDYFAGYELMQRFASGAHGRSKPWWFFLAVLPVAFLPWTAWLPVLARDLWRRWRRKEPLGERAALLLGWTVPPFIILSFSGSKLPTYILPLLPALALGVAAWWRAHPRRTVALHWMAAAMLAFYVVLGGLVEPVNTLFRQQADTRELAELAMAQPDFATASLFAARVRAHGFTFATGRLLSVTKGEADLMLKPTPEQRARVFKSSAALEQAMAALPAAYGLARRGDVPLVFPPERWRVVGTHGDFVLLGRTTDR